jgi:hypothetical protein
MENEYRKLRMRNPPSFNKATHFMNQVESKDFCTLMYTGDLASYVDLCN